MPMHPRYDSDSSLRRHCLKVAYTNNFMPVYRETISTWKERGLSDECAAAVAEWEAHDATRRSFWQHYAYEQRKRYRVLGETGKIDVDAEVKMNNRYAEIERRMVRS